MVEHLTHNPKIEGLNPTTRPEKLKNVLKEKILKKFLH
jgi:hypothetical protein